MSNEEARRQKRWLAREIAKEHKRKDREKLVQLRQKIRGVKARRKAALTLVRSACRRGRVSARTRAKERVRQIREEARSAIKTARAEETSKARARCRARKERVKSAAMGATQRRKHLHAAEQHMQRELRRIEAWAKGRKMHQRRTAQEARQESDDEVRQNLPEELLPLFERVKRQIKASSRQSRTESFLKYAEENPHEIVDAQEEISQREIARLIREEYSMRHAMRSAKRYSPTRAELAAIPF